MGEARVVGREQQAGGSPRATLPVEQGQRCPPSLSAFLLNACMAGDTLEVLEEDACKAS